MFVMLGRSIPDELVAPLYSQAAAATTRKRVTVLSKTPHSVRMPSTGGAGRQSQAEQFAAAERTRTGTGAFAVRRSRTAPRPLRRARRRAAGAVPTAVARGPRPRRPR